MGIQGELVPDTSARGRILEFDFPALQIGVAQYPDGPTGTTVFRFKEKAVGVVDVRGGAPGTYNVDWLRLGYNHPNLDAVVISGGSWYGLAAAGGVAGALKEDGVRSGHWSNLANVAGAIIYDLGDRRPNEIHPDEQLGAAALRAAMPGRFPQGAQGAGRLTMQGSYFGYWLHSGQGGAFRQIGETKIACFTVVNSLGTVVDRSGRLRHGNQRVSDDGMTIADLMKLVPHDLHSVAGSMLGVRQRIRPNQANTTISLVVTNQILDNAELRRLAVQVHGSMGRAIQPFATLNDGDVLFAASTAEVRNSDLNPVDLGVVASEVMWDAVLNSVPDLPSEAEIIRDLASVSRFEELRGRYRFRGPVELSVDPDSRGLAFTNTGQRQLMGLEPGKTLHAEPVGERLFVSESPFMPRFGFVERTGGLDLVVDPGPWRHIGRRDPGRT
jgi:L-aminopeptidase/D-esterase-like protein